MRGKKRENVKTAVISIVVAVLVWMAINYINPPELTTKIYNLPVRITGERELSANGLSVVDKDKITGLSVSVKGKRNDLLKLSGGVYVDIDVSSITDAGEYQLTGNVSLPSSRLSIDKVRFTSIPVKIEQIDEKEVKVRINQTGSIPNKLVKCESKEKTITITGARSELAEVKYAGAEIDISQLQGDVTRELSYILMDKNDKPITRDETIKTKSKIITVDCTLFDKRNVPVCLIMDENVEGGEKIDLGKSSVEPSIIEIGVKPHSDVDCVYAKITDIDEQTECVITEPVGAYIPDSETKVTAKLVRIQDTEER